MRLDRLFFLQGMTKKGVLAMIHERIKLFDEKDVFLTTYVHDSIGAYCERDGRPALIVLPGGAFSYHCLFEGEPVAVTFLQKGFNAFVLEYTVGDDCRFPDVLIEVSQAIKTVRDRAEEWNIDPHRVSLMGFSAGACLAGMSATQWNDPTISDALGVKPEYIRPDSAVIAYGWWDNSGTVWNDPEFYNPEASNFPKSCPPQLDLINYVGGHVCPLFVWHNQRDRYAPVVNSLMIAEKLCALKIPIELHLYSGGEHGMSVANPLVYRDEASKNLIEANPNVSMWVDMCVNWLRGL